MAPVYENTIYTHTHIRVYEYACTHTHIHGRIQTYIYIYIYKHMFDVPEFFIFICSVGGLSLCSCITLYKHKYTFMRISISTHLLAHICI